MYEIIGVFCGLAMVASAFINDINADSVSNNDFVQIETFEDYGGDIVPYVSDPYIEDNISDDVVEEIIVNQTVVDNSEVLERMDKLDSKLTLLNNSFNSVLSSSDSINLKSNFSLVSNLYSKIGTYDPSNNVWSFFNSGLPIHYLNLSDFEYDIIHIILDDTFSSSDKFYCFYTNTPILETVSLADPQNLYNKSIPCSYISYNTLNKNLIIPINFEYQYLVICCSDTVYNSVSVFTENLNPIEPPSDPSGNDPSQPSINVTYPQEVIDDVNAMKKQLVTLTGVTLLNLIIPMFVSVFKRMVDPFKKRRDD